MRQKWWGSCLAATFIFCALTVSIAAGFPAAPPAKPDSTEKENLASATVQQGLWIHELDKELSRLKEQQVQANEQILAQQEAVLRYETELNMRTKAAGAILRSYYMGERDRLWMLLFQMKSFHEVLIALDYIRIVIWNDFRILEAFQSAYEEQKKRLIDLENFKLDLSRSIAEHEKRREELVAVQAELERKLAALNEAEREQELKQIENTTKLWDTEGLPMFQHILEAVSNAVNDLPDMVADSSLLQVNGTNVEVRIPEETFNAFLKENNPIFEPFDFSFHSGGMTVQGSYNGMSALFKGNYVLETEPNTHLRYHIEEILFNGYALPEPTRLDLQKQYPLTFDPGLIISGLTVSDVFHEEDQLRVLLSFSFASRN